MITNADITIFNKIVRDRTHVFTPTVIAGVCFVHKYARSGGAAEQTDDEYIVRIPKTATINGAPAFDKYLPADAYRTLDDPTGYWTIQKDDIILKGAGLETVEAVKASKREFCLITEWQDDTSRGSDAVQHFRIGGT